MEKEDFRRKALEKRKNLSEIDRKNKSKEILLKIVEQPEFQNAENILCYVNFGSEVETEELIKKMFKNKTIIVPRVNHEQSMLDLCKINSLEDLEKSAWQIPEPREDNCKHFDIQNLDLAILPGTAFDKKGNRMGYGKGFFDKLLEKKIIPTIGLAFDNQLYNEIPHEEHDKKVDKIITEKKIVEP